MWKLKSILLLSLLAFLISSCELLGIGGKNNDGASGEVVWKVENQEIQTVGTNLILKKTEFTLFKMDISKHIPLKKGIVCGANNWYSEGKVIIPIKLFNPEIIYLLIWDSELKHSVNLMDQFIGTLK